MCTVTWWQSSEYSAYEVFFNRDEDSSRDSASPPRQAYSRGMTYLAPAATDHGGPWFLVNTHGVCLALLNHYPEDPALPDAPRSRGRLLRDMADSPSLTTLATRLSREDMTCYNAYHLLAFARGERPRLWTWDTDNLHELPLNEKRPMLTASSHLSAEVQRHREELFAREWSAAGRLEPAHLAQFHLHRELHRPAYGVLMDHPEARTTSISHLKVGPEPQAVLSYQSRPPELGALPEPAIIAQMDLSVLTPAL